jgi:hypothetical protein
MQEDYDIIQPRKPGFLSRLKPWLARLEIIVIVSLFIIADFLLKYLPECRK